MVEKLHGYMGMGRMRPMRPMGLMRSCRKGITPSG